MEDTSRIHIEPMYIGKEMEKEKGTGARHCGAKTESSGSHSSAHSASVSHLHYRKGNTKPKPTVCFRLRIGDFFLRERFLLTRLGDISAC